MYIQKTEFINSFFLSSIKILIAQEKRYFKLIKNSMKSIKWKNFFIY